MKKRGDLRRIAGELVSLCGRKLKPKQKQFLKLCCVAAAMTLTLGAVPFLKSHAAEGDNVVSKSNLVSDSNAGMKGNTGSSGEPTVFIRGSVEPKNTFDSGSLSSGLQWELDENGVLTLSGNGEISNNSFDGSTKQKIKSIKCASNCQITKIGIAAFSGCTALQLLTIDGTVSSVQIGAFRGCNNLVSVSINGSSAAISNAAFEGCPALQTVTLSGTVSSIGAAAFNGCSALEKVVFRCPSLQSCGSYLFNGCNSVTVELPCEHFTIGGNRITRDNMASYFGENASISAAASVNVVIPAVSATCTQPGHIQYWECNVCGRDFSDAQGTNEITQSATVIDIDPDAHDWCEWTGDAVQERKCNHDDTHTEKRVNPALSFGAKSAKDLKYTLGSNKPLELTIDRMDKEGDTNVFAYFTNRGDVFDLGGEVVVTGADGYSKTLTKDDCIATAGSLKNTLKASYLQSLKAGTYSLTASFVVDTDLAPVVSSPVIFTVVRSGVPSPGTGESGTATAICMALMLLASYGGIYSFTRGRTFTQK